MESRSIFLDSIFLDSLSTAYASNHSSDWRCVLRRSLGFFGVADCKRDPSHTLTDVPLSVECYCTWRDVRLNVLCHDMRVKGHCNRYTTSFMTVTVNGSTPYGPICICFCKCGNWNVSQCVSQNV